MPGCTICNKAFADQRALDQHMASSHLPQRQRGRNARRLIGLPNPLSQPRQRTPAPSRRPIVALGPNAKRIDGSTPVNNMSYLPNAHPADMATHVARIIGDTMSGRAFAMAALHPCGAGEVSGANVGDLMGMCDTMTGSVATPVYRTESFINFSANLFQTFDGTPLTPTGLGSVTYGIDIIVPPFPEIIYLYRIIDDFTGLKSPWVVVRQPDYDLPATVEVATETPTTGLTTATPGVTMASVGFGKTRIIGRGLTIELDAGSINNQGRIVVGQMQGQITPISLNVPSITTTNAAFVTGVGPPVTTANALTGIVNKGAGANTRVHLLSVPTDPAVITANCPAAYQDVAKHGAYVVQKFAAPLYGYEFKPTGNHTMYESANADLDELNVSPFMPYTALAIGSNGFDDSINLTTADSFWVSKTPGLNKLQSGIGNGSSPIASDTTSEDYVTQATFHPFVSDPSDMMTSVITLRNMPASSTSGLTASLRIKGRTYLESISNGSNPIVAPYVHAPAEFDNKALQNVVVAGKRSPDAYPASYNFLGTIFKSIWSAITNIGTPIMKGLGGLGIPIVSDVAEAAADLVHGINNLAGKF